MGRQAYLAKIAFVRQSAPVIIGRSAFEPTEGVTESEEYIQIGASQSEEHVPQQYRPAKANSYIQLYDERGSPINPHSRAYGKRLRDAQNDVLASVGVVERRRSPSEGLPGSYEEHLEELESEETAGNALMLASTVVENLCTWWIDTIRDRILTFRIPSAIPFVQIVASEHAASGNSIAYTGFTPQLVSTTGVQAILYSAYVYQPIERLVNITRASSGMRRLVRRSRSLLTLGFRLGLEVLFYPFYYHANLQRLGLIPARPFLPYWKSFIPLSPWSPIIPLSIHHDVSGSVISAAKAIVTSPMVLIIAEHFYERWIYSAISEAVETFVTRPDNAEVESPDAVSRDRAASILGSQQRSPAWIRNAIKNVLLVLGWCEPALLDSVEQKPSLESPSSAAVGGAQLIELTPLEIPIFRSDRSATDGSNNNIATVPVDAMDNLVRPITPPTPTASDHDDNDPRIRITSREGIVEMEVRLPTRAISSHTEVMDTQTTSSNHNHNPVRTRTENGHPAPRPHYRVTQLSTEPSQMIGAIVKAQLFKLADLPLKLIVLRLVATHYLASQTDHGVTPRFVESLPAFDNLSLRSIGSGISRVALCAAFELAIDLSLWSAQYLAVTTVGRTLFGWGAL